MAHEPTYRLADLRAQLEELDAKIAADAKKRRKLAVAVSALEALEGAKKKPATKASTNVTGAVAVPLAPEKASPQKPGKVQIHDAAAQVLREIGRPLNATVILEEINRRGLVGRQLERTSVVSALDRKYHDGEMFSKPAPGMYALIGDNGKKE